jgi:hypothetical protein
VRDFYREVADPVLPKYQSIHALVGALGAVALGRFNTPNYENSRELLVRFTGYDPIGDWIWPTRGMNAQQVRERLNEILRVRHSFAHGFGLPALSWTQSATGRVRLTVEGVHAVESFLSNLVRRTDRGMQRHISSQYGLAIAW